MAHELERNKALARRWFEEAWNQGHLEVGDDLIAPTFVLRSASPETPPGPAALQETVQRTRAAFPDLAYTLLDQTAEADRVVTHWTWTGTHLGELWGVAPTGRRVTRAGATMFRFREGKIVDYWSYWDSAVVIRQLQGAP